MSPKKTSRAKPAPPSKAPKTTSLLASLLWGPARTWLLAILAIAGMGGAWWAAWREVREHVIANEDYRLSADRIILTEAPPTWIRSEIEIKDHALSVAALDHSASLLDEDLAQRLTQAFKLQPWIKNVKSVSVKYRSVEVDLEYRQPVAIVELPGQKTPVDDEGYILPPDDFSPADMRNYPRLVNIHEGPVGLVGAPWGNIDVKLGAKIAFELLPYWSSFKLDCIVAPRQVVSGRDEPGFELFTRGDTQILWGSAPGSEQAGEMSASAKIERLRDYANKNGSLDGPPGQRQTIDLRGSREQFIPRTASRPPESEKPR